MSVKLREVEFIEAVSAFGGNAKRWETTARFNKAAADLTWDGPVIVIRPLSGSKHAGDPPAIVPLSRVHVMHPAESYPATKAGKK